LVGQLAGAVAADGGPRGIGNCTVDCSQLRYQLAAV